MACHLLPATLLAATMSGKDAALAQQGASLDDTLLKNFPVVIPDNVKFHQAKVALQAKRTVIKIRAENQTYSSANNQQIRIKFPNNALYDTRYGYFTCNLTVTATGGTYVRLANGAFSAFDRLHNIFGSSEIEDIRNYNELQNIVWNATVLPDVTGSIGVPNMGFGTQLQRNGYAAGHNFVIPLYSGVLNTELLPVHNVNAGLIIELFLANAVNCVETDGTNPVVVADNIIFYVERMDMDSAYTAFIKNWVATYGLQIGFVSWERYVNSLNTGTQQNITINNRASSVDGFYNIFVNSAQIANTTINDKFVNWTNPGLIQYNMLINGSIYPDEPIDTLTNNAAQAYCIYLRWLNKQRLDGAIDLQVPIPAQFFNVNQFLFIMDMNPYPGQNLIVPFSTLGNNATIILNLTFAAPIAANLQLNTWVRYYKQIAIYGNGMVNVIQ